MKLKVEKDEMAVGGILLVGISVFAYLVYQVNQSRKLAAGLPASKPVSMGVRG